ncbi:conjugative transposon protein TraM [Galbibacter sp. EGI 63066]|uniref:conjugative transposon protein TraM n=1 Tax=Galbibacter sp. EGI 63066 TaxID=2993559 RepID=UPI002249283C|nr:conjugative transposon protein TraM [Galbibacter sp. EGI 63066]MCX2680994.1 conjugative transposon protein TraM [Galbibacter sp. EGI 63066]
MTKQTEKRRKFLMVLPLLTLPFLATTFWALGGGPLPEETTPEASKLISDLPSPRLEKEPMTKMSLYEMAKKDSIRRGEERKMDPYVDALPEPEIVFGEEDPEPSGVSALPVTDPVKEQEVKVRQKLDELEQALQQAPEEPVLEEASMLSGVDPGLTSDIDKLEALMREVGGPGGEDPELAQIGNMLEKILDIQYPERAREKLQRRSEQNRGKVYPVHLQPRQDPVELMEQQGPVIDSINSNAQVQWGPPQTNGFYGLEEERVPARQTRLAVPAVIHQEQELVSGSTVKMRLTRDIFIDGVQIPEGAFVFGTCNIRGERLDVQVKAIRDGEAIFPVNLAVYDMDALPGIHIPGAITRESAREGADNAVGSMQLMPFDASLGTQVAGAGIEAAKGLFSKKVKLVRVIVKAGHPVLLVDKDRHNQY